MTFAGFSSSPVGPAVSSEAASSVGAVGVGISGGGGGVDETGAVTTGSGGALIREIGGRIGRLGAPSLSERFGLGFFSSMSETDSTGIFGAGFGVSAGFAGLAGSAFDLAAGGCAFGAAACVAEEERVAGFAGVSTFVFLTSFDLEDDVAEAPVVALLAVLRTAAGLRAGVFVVVLFGMSLNQTFCHFGTIRRRSRLCRWGLLVNRFMNLARFGFLHGENFDQILNRCIAQSLEVGESRFHQSQSLFLSNRERTR